MSNTTNDPRLSIGAFVEALDNHVTNLAECARRYDSQAKSKIVPGIVVESCQERIQSATNAGRKRTLANSGGLYLVDLPSSEVC
jgi:hypothetical protein